MTEAHFTRVDVAKMIGAIVGGLYLSGDATENDIREALRKWDTIEAWELMRDHRARLARYNDRK